jgi:hypothetical protein
MEASDNRRLRMRNLIGSCFEVVNPSLLSAVPREDFFSPHLRRQEAASLTG